jgi:hypothetical protein
LTRKAKRTIASYLTFWFTHVVALQLMLFPALADGHPASQAQEKQALGSLSSVGPVYVSDSAVPAESTIFTGDTVRTEDLANAIFTISDKGSLEITSRSQLVFTGGQQYVAELKSGIVVMSSQSGPSGINLRIGNFDVVAVTQGEQSTAKIGSASDGSFLVICSAGSIGVVPIEGPPNGILLQIGQSVRISPQGELSTPATTADLTTSASPIQKSSTQKSLSAPKSSHTGLIILGVVAAGGVGGVAAALSHKSSGQTVSPSSP